MPHVKKQPVDSNNKVGQTVKDYIEENRDLLQEMKKEAFKKGIPFNWDTPEEMDK
mgnify:CR=1 FL=1